MSLISLTPKRGSVSEADLPPVRGMRHIEDKLEFLKKNSKSIGKSWGYYNYDQSKKNWKVERERMHRRAAAEAGISQGLPSDLDEEEENPPDWADHLFRTAYGPLGGTANIDRSEPDQLVRPARSFSRTATETYIAKHGEEHPHRVRLCPLEECCALS